VRRLGLLKRLPLESPADPWLRALLTIERCRPSVTTDGYARRTVGAVLERPPLPSPTGGVRLTQTTTSTRVPAHSPNVSGRPSARSIVAGCSRCTRERAQESSGIGLSSHENSAARLAILVFHEDG
jgi:hypothetical protein